MKELIKQLKEIIGTLKTFLKEIPIMEIKQEKKKMVFFEWFLENTFIYLRDFQNVLNTKEQIKKILNNAKQKKWKLIKEDERIVLDEIIKITAYFDFLINKKGAEIEKELTKERQKKTLKKMRICFSKMRESLKGLYFGWASSKEIRMRIVEFWKRGHKLKIIGLDKQSSNQKKTYIDPFLLYKSPFWITKKKGEEKFEVGHMQGGYIKELIRELDVIKDSDKEFLKKFSTFAKKYGINISSKRKEPKKMKELMLKHLKILGGEISSHEINAFNWKQIEVD